MDKKIINLAGFNRWLKNKWTFHHSQTTNEKLTVLEKKEHQIICDTIDLVLEKLSEFERGLRERMATLDMLGRTTAGETSTREEKECFCKIADELRAILGDEK